MKTKCLLIIAGALYCQQSFAQVPAYVPTDSLKAWYPFSGNANDASVNANNGTVNYATLTTDRFGNPNSAYSFNGDSGYISCNKWISGINNNYTMSCWINLNFQDTTPGLPLDIAIILNLQGWGEKMIYWSNWANQKKSIVVSDRSDTSVSGITTNDSTLHTWQHIVFASNDTLISFYINGMLNSTTPRITRANWDSAYVGSYIGGDGYSNFYGTINGKIDDIGIWARTLSLCEIKALYDTSFLSIALQPTNQNIKIGNNAQFYLVSTDSSVQYQWQTSLGLGWQNLSDSGQFSGVTDDTLIVSNITLANNNQLFRCILSNGSCSDTTIVDTLTAITTTGINEIDIHNSYTISPNPATNQLTIHSASIPQNEVLVSIMNVLGEIIQEEKLTRNGDESINIKNLSAGIYFLRLQAENGSVVKRFVKQ